MQDTGPITTLGAALDELAAEAWVVDVSEWEGPVDRDVLLRIGDPALVCFGTHPDRLCPLTAVPGRHHVTFELAGGRITDAEFVSRFRELVGSDTTIRVHRRAAVVPDGSGTTVARPLPTTQEDTK